MDGCSGTKARQKAQSKSVTSKNKWFHKFSAFFGFIGFIVANVNHLWVYLLLYWSIFWSIDLKINLTHIYVHVRTRWQDFLDKISGTTTKDLTLTSSSHKQIQPHLKKKVFFLKGRIVDNLRIYLTILVFCLLMLWLAGYKKSFGSREM